MNFEVPLHCYLSYGIEEDKDEIDEIPEPEDGLVDVERVVHVAIDEAWRVHEGDEGKLFLLRRRDLGGEVIHHACNDKGVISFGAKIVGEVMDI